MSSELDDKHKLALADADADAANADDERAESAPLIAANDDDEQPPPAYPARARFERAPPSPWKRAALVLFVLALFWLSFRLRVQSRPKPAVVHADRYSKEFKYRPAASPIVTQKMPDGRSRVRGDDVKRIKLAQDKDRKKGAKKSA